MVCCCSSIILVFFYKDTKNIAHMQLLGTLFQRSNVKLVINFASSLFIYGSDPRVIA